MIEKNKLLTLDWKVVEKYLKKDSDDAVKMAVIEAEKIFIKMVNSKGYKAKSQEDRISQAIRELKNPDIFLKSREKVKKLISEIGFDFGDPYSGKEVVNSYKEAIEDILFGIIDEKKLQSFKYRFWRLYFYLYSRKGALRIFLIEFLVVILLMLFIADTNFGRNIFDLIIEKIHFIIRVIITVILLVFAGFFFVTFSIIILESRARKRKNRNGR